MTSAGEGTKVTGWGKRGLGCCRAFGSSPQVRTEGPALPPALWLADIPQPLGHLPDCRMAATGAGRWLSNTHRQPSFRHPHAHSVLFLCLLCSLIPATQPEEHTHTLLRVQAGVGQGSGSDNKQVAKVAPGTGD